MHTQENLFWPMVYTYALITINWACICVYNSSFLVYILLLIGYYNEVLLYYATRNTVQFSAFLAAFKLRSCRVHSDKNKQGSPMTIFRLQTKFSSGIENCICWNLLANFLPANEQNSFLHLQVMLRPNTTGLKLEWHLKRNYDYAWWHEKQYINSDTVLVFQLDGDATCFSVH